jgi:archaellum component FlaD/FlaE
MKKQTAEAAEGQTGTVKLPPPLENKRPPTMPAMMPANYKDPADDLPEFDEDEGYEKVETQTDLNKAVDDISEVDLEGTDKEDEDAEMDDDDEPMDDKTGTSAGTPASISSSANERTEDKLMDVLGSALATGIRGSEDKRMKDSNSLRDCSVNRTEGSDHCTE